MKVKVKVGVKGKGKGVSWLPMKGDVNRKMRYREAVNNPMGKISVI